MSGTRTAETSKNGQNAEEVPGKVVSPELEQQNCNNKKRALLLLINQQQRLFDWVILIIVQKSICVPARNIILSLL